MEIDQWFEQIASNNYVYIIAEISQNHDGSLGQAHAFIDALANTGVDAIKFQTHIAEAESTLQEPFRVKFSYEDETRYDYWKRMEFTEEQWKGLMEHSKRCNLEFLSSPFSVEAYELLYRIGVKAWKIGSGEVYNRMLLNRLMKTQKPILLSSGLSTYEDIDNQINYIKSMRTPYALFQCTTAYPTRAEEIGLNVISEMKERYGCPIGLSDHSGTIYPSLAAVAKGALLVEVHVTLSKYMFGPDVKASLDIGQLRQMVEGIRFISKSLQNPINKNYKSESMDNLKHMFAKGIYLNKNLKKGDSIQLSDISLKKPLNGINGDEYEKILGKCLKRDVQKGNALEWKDIE